MQQTIDKQDIELREMITFYLGDALYGIDILKVQEINKLMGWTPVPHSEDDILGILSLRGSIVTVVDLGKRLGTTSSKQSNLSRNIIVNSGDKCIGILVDRIGDVVVVEQDEICPAPVNVNGVQSKFFKGVFRTNEDLIAILDVEELFRDSKNKTD